MDAGGKCDVDVCGTLVARRVKDECNKAISRIYMPEVCTRTPPHHFMPRRGEGGLDPPRPDDMSWRGGSCPPKSLRHSFGGGEVGGFRCTPPPQDHPLRLMVRPDQFLILVHMVHMWEVYGVVTWARSLLASLMGWLFGLRSGVAEGG